MNTSQRDWELEQAYELDESGPFLTAEEQEIMKDAPAVFNDVYERGDEIEGEQGDYGYYYTHYRNPDLTLWYSFTTGEFQVL